MSDKSTTPTNATTVPGESPTSDTVKQTKEHEAVEKAFLETGHVKPGFTLRYVNQGGGSRAVIEKA